MSHSWNQVVAVDEIPKVKFNRLEVENDNEAKAGKLPACPTRKRCGPERNRRRRTASPLVHDPATERFDHKVKQAEALAIYKQRTPLVELLNACISQTLKLRRFAKRGRSKVRAEALLAADIAAASLSSDWLGVSPSTVGSSSTPTRYAAW